MFYKTYIDTLANFPAWGAGKRNLEKIIELGNLKDVDELANDFFNSDSRTATDTEINDFLHYTIEEFYPRLLGYDE